MPTIIRTIATLLLTAIIVLAAFGWRWAVNAPTPPAIGGRVVLGLTIAAALGALLRLWTARQDSPSR